ncbi:hypothetical protein HMPREF0239_00645 [Clostridium sp. ATCC BAA-442]|uniref:Uncharacterized protein n=1 Tax=Flavonifractor plautii ATCC 29863 TaxID=411475 RepID=G9YR86_FLAPL|nr:hypothetical protein HMPREF0372_02032 [Flavonifractor plautii ATCC 29863]ERI79852.1 hypothetical protein HMPREF0239_00645 [Clostridium sp. ATCC BAA-442]
MNGHPLPHIIVSPAKMSNGESVGKHENAPCLPVNFRISLYR